MIGLIAAGIGAIGSVISSTIAPAIAKFATGVLSMIAKIPGIGSNMEIGGVLGFIGNIIHSIAGILGIKTEDDPEILGAKAVQAEKGIQDFDNDAERYINYLQEEVKLDKKKFETMTEEEKLGCKAVGIALETKAIENRIGDIEISEASLVTLAKIGMGSDMNIDPKELLGLIKALKAAGITNMQDVSDYLEGKGENRIKTGEVLSQILDEGAQEKITGMKEAVRKYDEVQ